jgi:hypothetical protein
MKTAIHISIIICREVKQISQRLLHEVRGTLQLAKASQEMMRSIKKR